MNTKVAKITIQDRPEPRKLTLTHKPPPLDDNHHKSVLPPSLTVKMKETRQSAAESNDFKASGREIDLNKRYSWLEKVKSRSTALSRRCLIYEAQFSNELLSVHSLRYSSDGEYIACGYGSGDIQIRHASTGLLSSNVKTCWKSAGYPTTSIRYLPASNRFFASSAGCISLYDDRSNQMRRFCDENNNEISTTDLNKAGDKLVSGGRDAVVRLYDLNAKKISRTFPKDPSSLPVFCVKFYDEHSHVLLSGGWDDVVKIWDVRDPLGIVRDIPGPHICGEAIDTSGDTVVTGSWTVCNSLQTWDFRTGSLIESILPTNRPRSIDGEFLYCLQIFRGDPTKNLVLIGGGGVSTMEVVNVRDRKVTASHKVRKAIQTLDSDHRHVIFGGTDSLVRCFAVPTK